MSFKDLSSAEKKNKEKQCSTEFSKELSPKQCDTSSCSSKE
ncbi:hypothetical protein SAMN05660235_02223 [Sporolituus thermophilus DSM 23256]|uniref:Uncharacterized protein n=1 Tax=Sporolituus thermophilus DSM 23256 TaxID=1123285 RepID=A0A1G7MMD2_9FIRM|nr:hypothetical protein SAMN05660235_02223 [Sporolituus thermophilus DSM 23256]